MAVKCPTCRADNPDTVKFCAECGTKLTIPWDRRSSVTETIQVPVRALTTGSTLAGRYQVIEELGSGGMGRVYKVLDTDINEKIALKVLRPEIGLDKGTVERFSNELKFARKIRHKNVCAMFDLGKTEGLTFITMEFVAGEDLKRLIRKTGRLEVRRAVSIAEQVCEGLTEAHRLGVVHRDLKPQNIMVDEDGGVRIMDFGIARSLKAKGITSEGTVIGTPEYMSPEQVDGEEADQRSDIYSVGVILYEMVTGQVPFGGETPSSIALKHRSETPRDPRELNAQLPQALSRLILKCLEKERDRRPPSAEALLSELRLLDETRPEAAEPPRWKGSIAVLAFKNMSGDPEQDYFCEGLAEELINALAQIPDLWVVARTSAFSFKGEKIDIREIGRKLNVAHILEGSVRKSGGRLRITAQLINVADGYHLWSERYDRSTEDVFAVQDEICLAIVDKLRVKLLKSDKEKIVKRFAADQEAHDLYLRGRFFFENRTADMFKAMGFFEQAIAKDPDYALAYVGLADTLTMLQAYNFLSPSESFPRAKALAGKALDIDPRLGEAHATLGWIGICYERDWPAGESHFREAIRLNPTYGYAHSWFGLLLRALRRHQEATAELEEALKRDPLSRTINASVGWGFFLLRQYDKAREWLNKTLLLDPEFPRTLYWLGQTLEQMGDLDQAIAAFNKVVEITQGNSQYLAALGHAYALAGERARAEGILAKMDESAKTGYVSPYDKASIYAGLGDRDRALDWLEKGYALRETWVIFSQIDPRFELLHSDPRFVALLKN